MNLITLMPPLSLIKCLKPLLCFLCHICSTNTFFINTNFILLVTYLSYYIVLNKHLKKSYKHTFLNLT